MTHKSMNIKLLPNEDENFKFLAELGQGSYGKVYKAIDKVNLQYSAVKVDFISCIRPV